MADFSILNEGSIVTINPISEEAKTWIDDNVDPEAQWFGNSLAVEHRYAGDIIQGMIDNGLEIE